MAGAWVRAKTVIRIEIKGEIVTRYPGDWLELGGQEVRRRLAAGEIEIPDAERAMKAREIERCGVVVVGSNGPEVEHLRADLPSVRFIFSLDGAAAAKPFEFAFLWAPETLVNAPAVLAGFARLMGDDDGVQWDMLVCLADNELTLADVGSKEEQATTEEKVGTLRLPVYKPGVLWVRTEADGMQAAMYALDADLKAGVCGPHAFIRALYPFPLAICTLGADWIFRHAIIRT